jgi:ArsR family transcriptional regulator
MDGSSPADNRLELYRFLSDPSRLRLIAATQAEELSIGELADLLGESQPTVSRQVAPLRRLGLLDERRQGTRVLVRLRASAVADPVVADAVGSGRALCAPDRVLERVVEVVRRRDAHAREFFAQGGCRGDDASFPSEVPAYVRMLSLVGGPRGLAVDVGTGDGRLLEVLAPAFDRVVAVDREPARVERAAERLKRRGYDNVELVHGDVADEAFVADLASRVSADAVFASRVLHHAPRPADAVRQMTRLVGEHGALVILDYVTHQDERMRAEQADPWLGFGADELAGFAREAGLAWTRVADVPASMRGAGPDAHLAWQVCVARRERASADANSVSSAHADPTDTNRTPTAASTHDGETS